MQSSNSVYQEQFIPSHLERFWQSFRKNAFAVFAFWVLVVLVIVTIAAPWLTPFDPNFQTGLSLLPPSWDINGKVEYFLGTDDLSRDILSRLVAGSRSTFGAALVVAFSAGVVGVVVGIIGGMLKGIISSILNHLLDAALSIPSLLLAIILVAVYGTGEKQALFAVWLALVPRFIRATYLSVSDEMKKEYILSARLDGASDVYLLYYSILPNILVTLANTLTRSTSTAILDIAALGFLGLSSQAASPEWGNMLRHSIEYAYVAPWTVALPGFAIALCVLMVNLFGDGVSQSINAGTE